MPQIREARVLERGSPPYTHALATIAAAARAYFDLAEGSEADFAGINKYLPASFLNITNDDVIPVYLILNGNQQRKIYVASSSEKTISGSGVNIWNIEIYNPSATIATVDYNIVITVQKQAKIEEKYQRTLNPRGLF